MKVREPVQVGRVGDVDLVAEVALAILQNHSSARFSRWTATLIEVHAREQPIVGD